MALVVEDGTGLDNAESYLSVNDADSYFETMRGDASEYASDWLSDTTTDPIKEACLRWATKLIDKLWRWDGQKSTTTQKLRWPRSYVYDDEGDQVEGDEIPDDLKWAVAEQARALLVEAGRVDDQETGLTEGSAGPLRGVFDKYDRKGALHNQAKQYLQSFGTPKSGGSREVVRA